MQDAYLDLDNPYRPPGVTASAATDQQVNSDLDKVWRDGPFLVLAKRGARLPSRCFVCNQPAEGPLRLTVRQPPSTIKVLVALLILGPFMLLFMWGMLPAVSFRAYFCQPHRATEQQARRWLWGLLLGGMGLICLTLLFASARPNEEIAMTFGYLGGFISMLAGILYAVIRNKPLRAKKIDRHYAWLERVSPEYLASLHDISVSPVR
jgi:hypothetical protein